MGKDNSKNLRPVRSKSEARERGRKGGLRSGEARRERKKMREELTELLSLPCEERKEISNQRAALLAVIEKAVAGKLAALTFIRDTIGEKPTDKTELTGPDGSPLNPVTIIVDFGNDKPEAGKE